MSIVIAYLVIDAFENDNYAGAVLITDERGIPLDFRYTEPVKPSRIQRVIYGDALEVYLRQEVIVKSLMKDMTNKPEVWIVDNRELLDNSGEWSHRIPVILLEQTNFQPMDEPGSLKRFEEGEYLVQLDDKSGPWRLLISTDDQDSMSKVVKTLVSASASMEVQEPLNRARDALKLVVKDDGGK